MGNPVDEVLEAKRVKTAQRDQKHLELWQTWKSDPNPKTLQPLLKSFDPVFGHAVRSWKAPNVNDSAFRAELATHAIKAFENYDPARGASLSTHVTQRIQKSKRFNTQAQNLAYIPEDKARFIGPIDAAKDQLTEELGREPNHHEIASIVGISAKKVKEIQSQRLADIRGSAFMSDPTDRSSSRDQEIVGLLRYELTGDEIPVYDKIYGEGVQSTGSIAKQLGLSASQVSRLKNRIAAKYNQFK